MIRVACPAKTPLGVFTAIYEDGVIRRVLFPDERPGADIAQTDASLPFSEQIAEYFSGRRKSFELPVMLPGTQFRRNVYKATISIPYGRVAAYSDVALAAGHPLAMRAVGSAMKANPLPLLIPCHRVVHKSEKINIYRGGCDIKCYLLNMESRYI